MAIIKCPECGHQISDKAPTCPSCGVEIAGNITRCRQCGEVFLSSDDWCPHCHCPAQGAAQATRVAPVMAATQTASEGTTAPAQSADSPKEPARRDQKTAKPQPKTATKTADKGSTPPPPRKKAGKVGFIVSFVIALIICGVCFYMYNHAQEEKEMDEWRYAMNSADPLVLQSYLDTFKDAPEAHRDSIEAHLKAIKMVDEDWTNTLVSASRTALEDYLRKYPDSKHRQEAKHLIDSIDWAQCQSLNTVEAYQDYMARHDDGDHYDEAEDAMRKLKAQEITAEERTLLTGVMHNFFVSINSRDEGTLLSTVAENLSLLDKTSATKADVVEFMNRWYKDGVTGITFKLPPAYDIKKREVADGQYEYNVVFTATQDVQHTDAAKNTTNKYRVNSIVNPDGKIASLKLTKLVE